MNVIVILYYFLMLLGLDFFYIGIVPSIFKIFPMIASGKFGKIVLSTKIKCAKTNFPGWWIENGINTRIAYSRIVVCEHGIYFKNTLFTYILGVYFDELDKFEFFFNSKGDMYVNLIFKSGNYINIYLYRENSELFKEKIANLIK